MMKRVVCLALALAAVVAGPLLAASPTWQNYSWEVPLVFGDYIAVAGGDSTTLGSMTISRTPDSRGITGGAIYFYDASGKMVTQGINGTIAYTDDADIAQGAPLATTPLTAYVLSGPPRGGPGGDQIATPTDDVISWAWTGPRAGTLTVNGKTQKMVQAYSGPPLVGDADYSGEWLVVARRVRDYAPPNRYNTIEQAFAVRLTRVPSPRNYIELPFTQPGFEPWGPVALPTPGATLYDVVCLSRDCATANNPRGALGWAFGIVTASDTSFLWLDAGGSGRALQASRSGSAFVVPEGTCEAFRVYAVDGQRILGRQRCTDPLPLLHEFAMTRLGPDTLDPRWDLPRCESQDITFNCNPFKIGYSDPQDQ